MQMDKIPSMKISKKKKTNKDRTNLKSKFRKTIPLLSSTHPGLKRCLPEGVDSVEAVYAMWRFYRFVLQHDYTLEWMRAKIRASLGY